MTQESDAGPARPRCILVVEDRFLAAESLAMMLRDLGCVVVGPTPTVAQALDLIARETVDGALLDINLRGELITAVADRLAHLGVPFVFLTAYAGHASLPEAYRPHPRILKPCDLPTLASALETMFESERPADELR